MTIDAWIRRAAPDRPALTFGGETLCYGEMARLVQERADWLTAAGARRGDRVAWYGLNHAEVFILLFACARLGAIFLPLNWRLSDGELDEIVADAAPRVMVCDDHFADKAARFGAAAIPMRSASSSPHGHSSPVGEEGPQGLEELPLLLVYTSGSTGRPKGVVLTQKALIANAQMSVEAHDLRPTERVLNVLPLFHVGGLNILPTPAFSIGAEVVLHDRFDPVATAKTLPQVQHAITVPTVLQAILNTPDWRGADLSGLRSLSIGSTDVPTDLIETVHQRGVPVIQVYGATETCPFAIYQSRSEAMATVGSIGRAGSRCEVRLVAEGRDVPDGTPGEIWVRGDNTLHAYWRAPDLTAEALQDGWFRTGDVAVRQPSGLYYFADRLKHVIISGGENIYPAEIERILRTVPGIAEVAVVGRPDPRWGEVPVAVVVGDASRDQVMAALDGTLARYKHPRDVIHVDALPRNAMGKVVAAEVRRMIQG